MKLKELTPHDYQIRGKDFWLKNPRAYLAVDMGLGKTLTTLLALKEIGLPALIIAPVRTIHTTWPDEIKKWGFDLTYSIIHGPNKKAALSRKVDIYITNFESIPYIYDQLVQLVKNKRPIPFEVGIIDEGSKIKSSSTQRFKYLDAMRQLFPKYRLLLSGTPAPNTLMDLWAQYFWLTDGKALGTRLTHFRNAYFTHVKAAFRWDLIEGSEEEIYEKIKPYTFRLDAKDHLDLPDEIQNEICLEFPPKLKKQYKELEENFFLELENVEHEVFNKASLSMKLRQFLQGGLYYDTGKVTPNGKPIRATTFVHDLKMKALIELINDTGKPVLCAIQFKFELDIIRKAFPDVPVIVGGTPAKEATQHIRDWNAGKLPLLICHPASLSHGVNLQTGGSTICWYGMTWSLEQYLQFNARLQRQGQEETVVIHHLLFKDTIDYRVFKCIAKKNMNQRKLLDYLRNNSL